MQAFTTLTANVAVLDRTNVDTDQVIPKQFLKRIERTGYGEFLFFDWGRLEDGSPNPDFELNAPQYQDAGIMVTGPNFGCGSSREHAVWAIYQHGFKAIIAPSFAEIFHKNCFQNGLCPVLLEEAQVSDIMARARAKGPEPYSLTIDLETCLLSDGEELSLPFVIHQDKATHDFRRRCLLESLDEIDLTLQHEDAILAYEKARGIA